MSFTRREALRMLGLAGLSLGGCASESEDASSSDDALSSAHCSGSVDGAVRANAGSAPDELRRYEKIVVVMMENRSFDHYFGHLSLPPSMGGEGRKDVDGLKGNEVQFLDGPSGRQEFRPFKATNFEIGDIDHEWPACHGQFNNGAMDGFVKTHFEDLERLRTGSGPSNCIGSKKCADLRDPMAYFGREDTPVFHQLFDNYALCDRWFSSVMGPTWPNRCFLHAATSCGLKANERMPTSAHPSSPNEARTIWYELDDKCVSSVNYYVDFAWALGGIGAFSNVLQKKVFGSDANERLPNKQGQVPKTSYANTTFEEACRFGCLPTVSVIDPAFVQSPCDDHPPHDIKSGQAFVAGIYKCLTSNLDQWSKTLLIITYDEHGSFYDHVTPPKVQEDERPEFQQLGFRVPALIVGPYVKKNFVSHVQHDHASFLSTITRRFGLTPLNRRVQAANDVRDCIDRNAVETAGGPSTPIAIQAVDLSESLVHESIRESRGQSELANVVLGGPATLEQKRRATDELLGHYDRLGVARIRR